MVVFLVTGVFSCCSEMNSLAIIDNHVAAYRMHSVYYMEREFIENEDLLNGVADTMWSRTLQTIASATALREKMEGEPHFCKQPKRFFEKIRGYPSDVAKGLSRRLCTATGVYRHFDKIVENINKCQFIDIRTLSIKDLYECQTLSRALVLNDAKRPRSSQTYRDEELQGYTEEDFRDLLAVIQESPAFRGVAGDKTKTSSLLVRVATSLTCRQ